MIYAFSYSLFNRFSSGFIYVLAIRFEENEGVESTLLMPASFQASSQETWWPLAISAVVLSWQVPYLSYAATA